MTAEDERDRVDYEVGYGKPPSRTRFAKGISGNPKGRPKRSDLTPAQLARKLLKTRLKSDSGRKTKHTVQDQSMAQLAQLALDDVSAAHLLFSLAHPAVKKRVSWPAPGFEDTKFGVLMELEVCHGAASIYAGVQA